MNPQNQIPPITVNGNWVESVKDSMPDHAKDIKLNLDSIMRNHGLEEVDAHACAFAAALSASNGGLAFEIEMNSPLFLNDAEREASKAAAALMGMNNVWYPFVNMVDDLELKQLPLGLRMNVYANHGGVSKQKFEMYALAASIVGKCEHCVKSHYDILKAGGMTVKQLQAVGKIAAIVNAIGKIAI
jgi:alkyl hydroperoxide reductase subunit D